MRLSHLVLLPALVAGLPAGEPAPSALSAGQQRDLVAQIADLLRDQYVFPDLAAAGRMPARQPSAG